LKFKIFPVNFFFEKFFKNFSEISKIFKIFIFQVRVVPSISEQCKHYMHQTACYHMFKICEPSINPLGSLPSGSDIVSLCRDDCDNLKV